jgi:hypothetical protein
MGAAPSRSAAVEAAEVERLKAEAAAVALRASSDAATQKAEAAAVALRASSDAATQLERQAKLKIEKEMAEDSRFRWKVVFGAGALAIGGLAADYYLHTNPSHIKRRMRKVLLSTQPLNYAGRAPLVKLPVLQPPLVPSSKISEYTNWSCCPACSAVAVIVPVCCWALVRFNMREERVTAARNVLPSCACLCASAGPSRA